MLRLATKLSLVGMLLTAMVAPLATTHASAASMSHKPWFGSRWFGFGDPWFRCHERHHGSQGRRHAAQPRDLQQAHTAQGKTSVKPISARTQLEPKGKTPPDLVTTAQSTVGLSPPKSKSTQEQVAAATEVAERTTVRLWQIRLTMSD